MLIFKTIHHDATSTRAVLFFLKKIKPTLRCVCVVVFFLFEKSLAYAAAPALDTLPPARSAALRILDSLRAESYLAASLDTLPDGTWRIVPGPAMRWVQLRIHPEVPPRWLRAARVEARFFEEKKLRHDVLLRTQNRLLEVAENNGYPFASVWLDSVQVQADGAVSATLRLATGRYFSFNSLKINGDVRLPAKFLPQYLGLQPGTPYSRERLLRTRDRLRDLPYVEQTANPTVTFAGDAATVNLWLKKRRAGRFDLLIGLLPRPENDPRGGVLVTGSLNAAFQNALNLGERLSIDFERLRPETQKLDVQAAWPYVLGTVWGLDGRLHIFKRDSTWLDAQGHLGVAYPLRGTDVVQFFWENKTSSILRVDTLALLAQRRLPANLDYRLNGFGAETQLSRLDYRFNPQRGWAVTWQGVAGVQQVRRNPQIEQLRDPADAEFRFETLYDTVALRATRFRSEMRAEVFLPVAKRSTVLCRVRGGGIFSEKKVYQNEQYRLGGHRLLRGFDEESLLATRWAVATLEWRLLVGPNSYMGVFSDYGYLENITTRTRNFLRPWGLGAGMNFEVQTGIFGISAAAGRRDAGDSFDFRALKFHVGYVSLF
jgi:outer membrane protein assembly factor BamA